MINTKNKYYYSINLLFINILYLLNYSKYLLLLKLYSPKLVNIYIYIL